MTKNCFLIGLVTLSIWNIACQSSNSDPTDSKSQVDLPINDTNPPLDVDEVYSAPTFTVDLQSDKVYGQGQTHSNWNALNPDVMDLKLDLYVPDNDDTQRPLVVFTHGGGWSGGDKAGIRESEFCNFFAERGFVCASLNYRLRGDRGTVPQAYFDAVSNAGLTADESFQVLSMYPAGRDCKAAVRWLVANAPQIGFNVDAIALIGGSAGAHNSIVMDVSEPEDYRDELSLEEDPTLASTNINVAYEIQAVVNHWGGAGMMQILGDVYGHDRFDSTDAPLLIVHGTIDEISDYSNAEELVTIYNNIGVHNDIAPLSGAGHGAWGFEFKDGTPLPELSFDFEGTTLPELSFGFITEQLELTVVE